MTADLRSSDLNRPCLLVGVWKCDVSGGDLQFFTHLSDTIFFFLSYSCNTLSLNRFPHSPDWDTEVQTSRVLSCSCGFFVLRGPCRNECSLIWLHVNIFLIVWHLTCRMTCLETSKWMKRSKVRCIFPHCTMGCCPLCVADLALAWWII